MIWLLFFPLSWALSSTWVFTDWSTLLKINQRHPPHSLLPAHNPSHRWFVKQAIIHSQVLINGERARLCLRGPVTEEGCRSAFWEMCCWETLMKCLSQYPPTRSLPFPSEKASPCSKYTIVILRWLHTGGFKYTNHPHDSDALRFRATLIGSVSFTWVQNVFQKYTWFLLVPRIFH